MDSFEFTEGSLLVAARNRYNGVVRLQLQLEDKLRYRMLGSCGQTWILWAAGNRNWGLQSVHIIHKQENVF